VPRAHSNQQLLLVTWDITPATAGCVSGHTADRLWQARHAAAPFLPPAVLLMHGTS
jgi:hypothetical protein